MCAVVVVWDIEGAECVVSFEEHDVVVHRGTLLGACECARRWCEQRGIVLVNEGQVDALQRAHRHVPAQGVLTFRAARRPVVV